MTTVTDLWRRVLPADTELLGGAAGLERRVEWATALRTRPPAFDAIKGGELAFVPIHRIRVLDDRLDLAQVMSSLAEKGGVAVAVVGDVSGDSIAVANATGMPLLRLPDDAPLADLQQAAVRYLVDQRTRVHEREHELRLQLTELALGGAGVAAILDHLATIVGLPAVLQDADGTVQHVSGHVDVDRDILRFRLDPLQRWMAGMTLRAADPPVGLFEEPVVRLVAPIPLRQRIGGYVSVIGSRDRLDELARLGVARAASACAIELDREHAVRAARDDLEGEFITSVVSGAYSSEAALTERGRRLGFDVGGNASVAVIRSRNGVATLPAPVFQVTKKWSERQTATTLTALRDGALVVLVAGDDDPRSVIDQLVQDWRSVGADSSVLAGTGRVHTGSAGIRESFREAEQAERLGRRLHRDGRVVRFADLGLHRVLFAMRDTTELRDFLRDHLQTLLDYDTRNGSDLVATLDAFFSCHGSPTEIAQRLGLHRNTVLYRLRRIEEVGNCSLDDPGTRLDLHLSLRAREVLDGAATDIPRDRHFIGRR